MKIVGSISMSANKPELPRTVILLYRNPLNKEELALDYKGSNISVKYTNIREYFPSRVSRR